MKVELVLDRIEEGKAVFITKDKQEIIVPAELIKDDLQSGQTVWLNFEIDQKSTEEKEDLAKKMLNEIISSDKTE